MSRWRPDMARAPVAQADTWLSKCTVTPGPGTRVAARGLHWRPGNFKLKPSSSTVARPAPHSGQSDGQWSSTGSLTVGAAACQSLSLRAGRPPAQPAWQPSTVRAAPAGLGRAG